MKLSGPEITRIPEKSYTDVTMEPYNATTGHDGIAESFILDLHSGSRFDLLDFNSDEGRLAIVGIGESSVRTLSDLSSVVGMVGGENVWSQCSFKGEYVIDFGENQFGEDVLLYFQSSQLTFESIEVITL